MVGQIWNGAARAALTCVLALGLAVGGQTEEPVSGGLDGALAQASAVGGLSVGAQLAQAGADERHPLADSDTPFARRMDVYERDPETPPSSGHVASIVEADNGDILYSFNANTPVEGRDRWIDWPYVARIPKGGERFGEPLRIDRDSTDEVHNTVLWNSGNGRIFLFYTTQEGPRHQYSRLDVVTSDDDGFTWSEPRTMREEHGLMFGTRAFRMSNGEAILPVYVEAYPRGVGFFISGDDFETWEVYPGEQPWPGAHPTWTESRQMPGTPVPPGGLQATVVELDEPGHLLAYMRTSTPYSYKTRSEDYGRTWTVAESTGVISSARVALLKLDNGHLLMAYNPTDTSPRSPLRVSLSEDDGETWAYSVEIETDRTKRFDYPYLYQCSQGLIHLGYTHLRENMRYAVFNEAFVRNGEDLESDTGYSVVEYRDGEIAKTPLD